MLKKILYTKPSITSFEIDYCMDAIRNGWGDNCYDYIYRFEEDFRSYIGVKYAIATSSCTGALHMGMAALGIGPGDEVILADTNWIATVSPVVHLGAKPVFVDILSDSWCIDPSKVEAAITPRTKAIVAVHLYGNLCLMDELLSIGDKYQIPVIEDAAEAIGSVYKERRAGSIGSFGAFSFHGSKTLTAGEGGLFVTNDESLYNHVLALSNHGRIQGQSRQFWAEMIGFKYKMSNIQAAIGLAQVQRIHELVSRKQEILAWYKDYFKGYEQLTMNLESEGCVNGAWMPTLVFQPESGVTREILQKAFAEKNIDARVFFWPLSSLPMFESVPANVNSWDIPNRAINLPSYHDMTDDDLRRVGDIVLSLLR